MKGEISKMVSMRFYCIDTILLIYCFLILKFSKGKGYFSRRTVKEYGARGMLKKGESRVTRSIFTDALSSAGLPLMTVRTELIAPLPSG